MADSQTKAVDSGSVRTHPWVTYLLAVLLVGGSLLVLISGPNAAEEAAKSPEMAAARKFFELDPDVNLSGRLAHWIGPEHIRKVRAEHDARRARGGVAVLSQRMRDKSQRRFDTIQREAFANLQELPSWRLGVIDSRRED